MGLIDDFNSLDESKINEWIKHDQEENLHLEFKTASPSLDNRDDRRNLAKAISGFSNSDGGIVVWGIKTKTKNGIDCASDKQLISHLSLFLVRLNELTGSAANPVPDGVLHKKVLLSNDTGIAATFVPSSDSGPHMAKLGEDRYYKRSGSQFVRMEHFDLEEDMFGRRKRPKLQIRHQVIKGAVSSGPEGTTYEIKIVITLENEGRGSAVAPFLEVVLPESFHLERYGITNLKEAPFFSV